MEYIISAVWIGLELFCGILFSGAFLPKRNSIKRKILLIVTIWLCVCIYTNLPINQLIKQIFLVLTFTGISLLLYEGTYVVHIVIAVICYIFIATIDAITVNGMCSLLEISYDALVWRKLTYITLTTADKLIAVFFSWLLYRYRKKGTLGKLKVKWLLLSILFPVVSTIMFLVFFYYAPRNEDISLTIVFFSSILMVANIAMLYIIDNIEKCLST